MFQRVESWGRKALQAFLDPELTDRPFNREELARFDHIGRNFYDRTYRLLEATGVFEDTLTEPEDREFFTQRVQAYFLDGMFPTGDNRPINGRRNKVDPRLRRYLFSYLPYQLTLLPGSTFEENALEQTLDYAAENTYRSLHLELQQSRLADNIVVYFLGALHDQELSLTYSPPAKIAEGIKESLTDYQTIKRSLQRSREL